MHMNSIDSIFQFLVKDLLCEGAMIALYRQGKFCMKRAYFGQALAAPPPPVHTHTHTHAKLKATYNLGKISECLRYFFRRSFLLVQFCRGVNG